MTPFDKSFESIELITKKGKLFGRKNMISSANDTLTLLLHGHTQNCDMWSPLANKLALRGQSVLAVDLPGLGRSSQTPGRYDKHLIAKDLLLAIHQSFGSQISLNIVGHDKGVFVAYAMAHQARGNVARLVFMDAIPPGIGAWNEMLQWPMTWHFGFYGEHAVKLVKGRERIYLDRFWDEFAADPTRISEKMRQHFTAFYEKPGAVDAALSYFESFGRDAEANSALSKHRLLMPMLGLGGAHSLGKIMETHLDLISQNHSAAVVEDAGHWLIEENPVQTIGMIEAFLTSQNDVLKDTS